MSFMLSEEFIVRHLWGEDSSYGLSILAMNNSQYIIVDVTSAWTF